METKSNPKKPAGVNQNKFRIEGRVELEGSDPMPSRTTLKAYAFDRVGEILGAGDIARDGGFSIEVGLPQPADVELFIGPSVEAQMVRRSAAYSRKFSAIDWSLEGEIFRLRPDIFIPHDTWRLFLPIEVCISGHVRKIEHEEDGITVCPVPFVKVEIFDVDREFCWWPYLRRWWDILLDRPVIRIPELLRERPIPPKPFPEPDPVPDFRINAATPLPAPPSIPAPFQTDFTRVGEARLLSSGLAAKLDRLTLNSLLPPWIIFPGCFYSRELVCETRTDCSGYFRCCFNWWPFQFRRGRLRFDGRPDIIIRVTQLIDGVETVIYLDPYTSTRWNVNTAHIDLYLDDERVLCGGGCQPQPRGTTTFFTRIGDDEVYQINQANGLFRNPSPPSNMAYGSTVLIYGLFGDALTTGAPVRYYKLSHSKDGSTFTPIITTLEDTRVAKGTLLASTHKIGPYAIGSSPAVYYEIRDFANYYWYNPDWIGEWDTRETEEDTGKYILRLEVFDENGVKLTSAVVDYRDGTVTPPAVLPAMADRCDLVITLDNKPPVLDLQIPGGDCGVIPFETVPPLDFNVNVSQENGRLHSWHLEYTKGADETPHLLDGAVSNSGAPGTVSRSVDGNDLLVGLTSSCAFALKLHAWAHIRNGRHLVYYREQIKAIAIEKCS